MTMMHEPSIIPSRDRDSTSPAEIARCMPNGVKNWVRAVIDGHPLEDLPGPILTWLRNHNVIRESTRKPGRLALTRTGSKVITQIRNRMNGGN